MTRSSTRLVSLFAALIVLLLAGPGAATRCGEWQGPPPSGDNVRNLRTHTVYAALGKAIEEAQSGDTLSILQPMRVGAIKIDKDLHIIGTFNNVLTPAIDTCAQGSARGWFQVAPGVDLTLFNLAFDGSGYKIYEAFRHQGTGTFGPVTFSNISYEESGPAYQGTAIAVFGDGAKLDVGASIFKNIGRTGILYYGRGVTGTVNDVGYFGKGHGNHLDYGVDVEAGAVVTIKGSSFHDCLGSAAGSRSAAVEATTFQGAGTSVTLENNTIHNNTVGIAAGYGGGHNPDTTQVVAHGNTITGNHSGLDAETDKPINATGNHWGCPQGPGHPGCDPVTGPYAYQVDTGYGPVVTWHFNASVPSYSPMNGESMLVSVTLDPAPPNGTPVKFTPTNATLSTETPEVVDGRVATTFTASNSGGSMTLDLEVEGSHSKKQLDIKSPEHLIVKLANLKSLGDRKYSVEMEALGGGNRGQLYGSLGFGYSAETFGCPVGLSDAKLLDKQWGGGTTTFEFQLPAAWQGQTVHIQAVNIDNFCDVTQVLEIQP